MKKESLLEVKNIKVEFGTNRKNKIVAVDGVSFKILKGESFGLVGESGSGKSTIGRAIIRIYDLADGVILYKGQRISGKISKSLDIDITKKIQMIFQDPIASLNERAKIGYIVSEGLYNTKYYISDEDRKEKVIKALLDVGLFPEFASRFPHEFSGGQRQRIGIARALIMEPELVIADEPVSALDVSVRAQVLNLLLELQDKLGLTNLFISHDLSVVRYITDRVAVIYKGKILELAKTEELFEKPLHPYTRALLSAIPVPDPRREKNKKIEIYNPSCHDYSIDKAEWVEVGSGHFVLANKKEIKEYRRILFS